MAVTLSIAWTLKGSKSVLLVVSSLVGGRCFAWLLGAPEELDSVFGTPVGAGLSAGLWSGMALRLAIGRRGPQACKDAAGHRLLEPALQPATTHAIPAVNTKPRLAGFQAQDPPLPYRSGPGGELPGHHAIMAYG